MDNLSGGEKTVAALALLFAIHRYVKVYLLSGQITSFGLYLTNFSTPTAISLLPSLFWMRLMQHWTIPTLARFVSHRVYYINHTVIRI